MKTAKFVIPLVLALAAPFGLAQQGATQGQQVKQYKTAKLNRVQVDSLLAKPERLVVLDVRQPDELSEIGGFPVYLSIQSADVEKQLAYIPKDRNILTVSNHAGRALRTGDLLLEKGFKVVGAVGVQNYEEEGGVLVKIAPRKPRNVAPASAQ